MFGVPGRNEERRRPFDSRFHLLPRHLGDSIRFIDPRCRTRGLLGHSGRSCPGDLNPLEVEDTLNAAPSAYRKDEFDVTSWMAIIYT